MNKFTNITLASSGENLNTCI